MLQNFVLDRQCTQHCAKLPRKWEKLLQKQFPELLSTAICLLTNGTSSAAHRILLKNPDKTKTAEQNSAVYFLPFLTTSRAAKPLRVEEGAFSHAEQFRELNRSAEREISFRGYQQ